MKKITLIYLLLLSFLFLFSCPSRSPADKFGILTLENQSNYDIDMKFYGYVDGSTLLTDSISLNKNGGTWQKYYKEKGGFEPYTIFINQHSDRILSIFSIVVFYDNKKQITHWGNYFRDSENIDTLKMAIDFFESRESKRYLLGYNSYVKKTARNSTGCETNEVNYRYIFTNADYEAAKPIIP